LQAYPLPASRLCEPILAYSTTRQQTFLIVVARPALRKPAFLKRNRKMNRMDFDAAANDSVCGIR
jgi:hypothetical protein